LIHEHAIRLCAFFFSNTCAAYHFIKTKKKLVHCSVTTQMEWTPDGHKLASQLNTTRKMNSNMNYSHPAQPKQLVLSVAVSQRSIPQRERERSCTYDDDWSRKKVIENKGARRASKQANKGVRSGRRRR